MPNEDEVTTQEEIVQEEEVYEEQVEQQEDVEELKKKLATLEAQKEHWRRKAAEKKETVQEVQSSLTLSAGDMMAIKNADLAPQDMDLVEKFAKDNKLSLREALAHPHAKAILAYESELRNTAVATNVENVRRGSARIDPETLLNNASMGKIPTNDDEIEALIQAKRKYR
jgi:hypothetical protein